MSLIFGEVLLVVAFVFFPVAGVVYGVCLFIPNSKAYLDTIALNIARKAYLLAALFCLQVIMAILIEMCLFASDFCRGKRKEERGVQSGSADERRDA